MHNSSATQSVPAPPSPSHPQLLQVPLRNAERKGSKVREKIHLFETNLSDSLDFAEPEGEGVRASEIEGERARAKGPSAPQHTLGGGGGGVAGCPPPFLGFGVSHR